MNLSLVSPFVYLASEKISAENLFEGFNVDLQSTVDLIKSLSSYNPTVWTYMSILLKVSCSLLELRFYQLSSS